MKSILMVCCIFLFTGWNSSLFAQFNQGYHRNPSDPVSLNIPSITKSGKYNLSATFTKRRIKIKAMLYIPRSVYKNRKESPVIVFVHGGRGNKNYYKNNVSFMINHANRKKFILLSVQNYWGLGEKKYPNMDLPKLLYHTARATSEMLDSLIQKNTITGSKIFTTGHSSGGLTAVATALFRPDLYAGFGANKANFYEYALMEICTAGEKFHFDRIKRGLPVKSLFDMKGTSTLGGKKEAKRVKTQTPALRGYLKDQLGIQLKTRDYAKEGHGYSTANFNFFWSIIK